MSPCARCGVPVEGSGRLCEACASQEPIHARGEVIPPGQEAGASSAPPRPFGKALAIAAAADLLQLVFFPLFAPGALSPLNDVLDIVVAFTLVRLIGWHWAFLPTFLGELLPVIDELPCWTLAVLYVRAEHSRLQSA